MSWESGEVVVEGARLHYHRTGGDRPPLVLLHGFSDSGLCWTRVARDLEDEYDVVMPDARGHGESDRVGPGLDTAQRARDVVGLIAALGLDRPALGGHSMGAATAAEVVAQSPGVAACAVLEDPPWRDDPPTTAGRWDHIRRCQEASEEEGAAICRELHPSWGTSEIGPWVQAKRSFDLALLESVRRGPGGPWREIAGAIRCPVLLLAGDPDLGGIVTPEVMAEVAQLCGARSERLAGAGHNVRRERYDGYLPAVHAFLKETRPAVTA
ncbi:MAG: alpha/beta fold hydrolase [Candidatus Dormibacteraceae bacterium]